MPGGIWLLCGHLNKTACKQAERAINRNSDVLLRISILAGLTRNVYTLRWQVPIPITAAARECFVATR